MRKYFKGVRSQDADGWLLATSGYSNEDQNDWIIDTHSLHGDEIPEMCNDAMTFSQLVAGLLNCYYNNVETKGLPEKLLLEMGTVPKAEQIPHPDNPKLPF